MSSFGQLGQQSTGSLGSSLNLGNSGLPINSPSQSVYHTSYGLNSIGELWRIPARNPGRRLFYRANRRMKLTSDRDQMFEAERTKLEKRLYDTGQED